MATYFTDDFADLGTDWTQRYNTGSSWSESGGDVAIPGAATSGDWTALTWDDINSDADRDDVEILILWSIGTMGTQYPVIVRGSGADETPSHYSVRITATNIRTYKNVGADAVTQIATATKTFSASTDYWIRLRVNGTSIRARAWADGGSEPGTWDCDSTDSAVSGVGWSGMAQFGPAAGGTVKKIGIGTNGDTAPDSAVGGNTIAVPAGALLLAGFAPVVSATANQTIAVPTGTLTLSAFVPTVGASAGTTIAVPAGALTLAGFAPVVGVSSGAAIAVPAGALSLTAYAPDVSASNNYVSVPAGALTITGFAPNVSDGAASGFIKYFDVLSGKLLILRAL